MTRDLPKRIQLSRRKGYRKPEGAVVVARPTKWGNPYNWTEFYFPGKNTLNEARADAVERFRRAVIGFRSGGFWCGPQAHPDSYIGRIIRDAPSELRGKDLACWCPLDQPCHADVLLKLANGDEA